jgi:hypothetical protein
MNEIKVKEVKGPDEDGNFQVILEDGSLEALQEMFPKSTPEEAFQLFWTLASNHFKEDGDKLTVLKVVEDTASEDSQGTDS